MQINVNTFTANHKFSDGWQFFVFIYDSQQGSDTFSVKTMLRLQLKLYKSTHKNILLPKLAIIKLAFEIRSCN